MKPNATKIVFLGTGTPNPVPERSGPSLAIITGGRAYLVDCGVGVVRRAEQARRDGIPELAASRLSHCFLTHLHSDHTLGLPDLFFTPWVLERAEPLTLIGPPGTQCMAGHILAAWQDDICARRDGLERATPGGYMVNSTEVEADGPVYSDENITVEAFAVDHPPFRAYGFKFITADKTIVVSGDTAPCDNLITYATGCDVLIHEVYSSTGIKRRDPKWYKYHTTVHTSSLDLGQIAAQADVGQLLLYHQLFMLDENEASGADSVAMREAEMIAQIKESYSGEVYSANDLDVF